MSYRPQVHLVCTGAIDSVPSACIDDIETATDSVRQALAESRGGEPVSDATSRAQNCAIKYKT